MIKYRDESLDLEKGDHRGDDHVDGDQKADHEAQNASWLSVEEGN